MNIKHLFFCMLLITFSSCSKPGYEKAIAEWVQTDSHGTWTDLKFELLEVLETEDVTVSDSLRYLNNKSAQLSAVIQKAESPRALFKPSFFRLYGSRKKPESNGCHESHVPAP